MLETWSEGKAPPYGVQASPIKPGTVDLGGIAWGSYGGKVGVWRIINLLKQNGIRGTFCVNGRCAEIFPEAVAQIVKSGHDVAGHAYLQDQLGLHAARGGATHHPALPRSFGESLRHAPAGLDQPGHGVHRAHAGFLAAEGLIWHGDARDTDLPRMVDDRERADRAIPAATSPTTACCARARSTCGMSYKETFDYPLQQETPAFLRSRSIAISGAGR